MSVQLKMKTAVPSERIKSASIQKVLLLSGAFSSILYVFMNIICDLQYPGYNSLSQTVSELSAIDAPTRTLWVSLGVIYSLLVIAFGFGLWYSATVHHHLPTMGIVLMFSAVIGFFWPPMHQREVIASGGGTLSDTLHIVFTFITVPLMIFVIALGATVFGKAFRWYCIITLVVLLFFGILTGLQGSKLSTNEPTPWIGLWERINIGAYMLWVAVLSIILINKNKRLLL